MQSIQVHLKDYAGREFGGDYEAITMSSSNGKLDIELAYCGPKSSKRLSTASLSIDQSIVAQLKSALAK